MTRYESFEVLRQARQKKVRARRHKKVATIILSALAVLGAESLALWLLLVGGISQIATASSANGITWGAVRVAGFIAQAALLFIVLILLLITSD